MRKIALSWNSRTPEGIIANDKNFKNIIDYIQKGKVDGGQWIINFYGYDNSESKAFLKKIIDMLKKEIPDKNFRWPEEEMNLMAGESQYYLQKVLQELNEIPGYKSGIVALYEPIDYGYKIVAPQNIKCDVHKKIVDIFETKKLFLLLFGNIPYDIHHFEENSPLIKFVWNEYEIKEYGENELKVINTLKSHWDNTIIGYTNGNFEVVSGLEDFWEEIKLEERVNDLLNNFLEVPLKTKIEKMVYEKLAALSQFLENNRDKIGDKISYTDNEKISIVKEKSSKLFKAYFDKTALFDNKVITDQLYPTYELTPKAVFARDVKKSGFIDNKGKIKFSLENIKNYSEEFDKIAFCFKKRKPIFILGAGNSMASGAPDRQKMFKLILTEIYPGRRDEFEKMNYGDLSAEFQKQIDDGFAWGDIRFKVRELLDKLKPSIGHFHLTQLVKAKRVNVIITTNFDTLLEDSLMDYGIRSREFIGLVGEKDILLNEWDWVNRFPDLLKIFKICGDLYHGSGLAVDDNAANTWIENAVKALEKIDAYRTTDFFVILGHKFGEIELSHIFANKSLGNLTVVYVNPNEDDCNSFKNKYQHKSKPILISGYYGEFDSFMQELCRRLRERNLV